MLYCPQYCRLSNFFVGNLMGNAIQHCKVSLPDCNPIIPPHDFPAETEQDYPLYDFYRKIPKSNSDGLN